MDFISAQGRSFMIDFNPRMSNFAALDTRVTGLTPGLHRRLHDAVVHRRTHAFAPLDRSAREGGALACCPRLYRE